MDKKIQVAICGVNDLAKKLIQQIDKNENMELVAIFAMEQVPEMDTSGEQRLKSGPFFEIIFKAKQVDVLIVCENSAEDLLERLSIVTKLCNTVIYSDIYTQLEQHMAQIDECAKEASTISAIVREWYPTVEFLQKLYDSLPKGMVETANGGIIKITQRDENEKQQADIVSNLDRTASDLITCVQTVHERYLSGDYGAKIFDIL